jgi:thiol-disulfide isomerase/thioredoxin
MGSGRVPDGWHGQVSADGEAGSMGKADRIRQRNARERIAAQQTAARKAEARRRTFIAFGSVLAVVAIVVALIVVKSFNKNSPAQAAVAQSAQTVAKQITTVPAATLNQVGKGTTSPLTPTQGKQAVLTSGGKPEVVYMGAEYCPYCAAERWALTVALSRFGTFSNLHFIHSSSADVYASTPTLSYYQSGYTSKYIDFEPVELQSTKEISSGVYATLQKPTTAQSGLMSKFDAPPYVPSNESGSYPFVDFGNQYLVLGAQYLPSALAKLSWAQVAADIRVPSSSVAQDVDGAANSITAAICKITKDAPAAVCSSAAAKAGEGSL